MSKYTKYINVKRNLSLFPTRHENKIGSLPYINVSNRSDYSLPLISVFEICTSNKFMISKTIREIFHQGGSLPN